MSSGGWWPSCRKIDIASIEEVIHDLKALSSGRPLKARPAINPPSEDSKLKSFFAGTSVAGDAPFVAQQVKLAHRRKKHSGQPAGLVAAVGSALLLIGGLLYLLLTREQPKLAGPGRLERRGSAYQAHGASDHQATRGDQASRGQ